MRLTLRTLLAYLDDVLSAEDAAALKEKIEGSSFARDLISRIQKAVGDPRVSAPRVEGKGLGRDANTVSEYLDGTMQQERVGDFEKVCLDKSTNVHLAEIGACHQILTLVLGETADVPPALRDRINRIAELQKEQAAVAGSTMEAIAKTTGDDAVAAETAAAQAATASPKEPVPVLNAADKAATDKEKIEKPKPEVPEYLRSSGGMTAVWPYVATVGLVFLFVVIALRAIGPFDASHPLAGLFGGGNDVVIAADGEEPEEPEADNSEADAVETDATEPADAVEPEADAEEPPADPTPVRPTPPKNNNPPEQPEDGETPAPAENADGAPPVTDPPVTDPPVTDPPVTDPPVDPESTEVTDPAIGETPKPPVEPPPAGVAKPKPLGAFKTEAELFGYRQEDSGVWLRVNADQAMLSETDYVSLPGFRPQFALTAGANIALAGEARFSLTGDASGPGMAPRSGRFVLTASEPGFAIQYEVYGREAILTLVDLDTVVAIDTQRIRPPGIHPEIGPIHIVTDIITVKGQATWFEDGKLLSMKAGQALTMTNSEPPIPFNIETPPAWIDPRNDADLDRRAARTLAPLIDADKSLSLALNELVDDRRAEVRSLAIRGLCALNYFEPYIESLNDQTQRSYWAANFDAAQVALARSQEAAVTMRTALEKERGDDAMNLYELLTGYSPDQLAAGASSKLVSLLDHEDMDIRVLTFENLRRITNTMLLYRPEASETRRRIPLQRWREKLAAGEIVYTDLVEAAPLVDPTPPETTDAEPEDGAPE